MVKQQTKRQRIRSALLVLSFLLFPITMNYLSPYVIIDGAANGVVNGSLILFGLMFLSALVLGRAWCGWVCPAGGLAEIVEPVNRKPVNGRRIDWIKWLIWLPWLTLIIVLAVRGGGYRQVDFTYLTVNGISVAGSPDRPILFAYFIYYIVIFLFAGLAVVVGRRAGCHTICWMAPFMILGRWIRNRFGWASLRLQAEPSQCTSCKVCTSGCPMSLDVNAMVQLAAMENSECILCGTCVDNCKQGAIRYQFSPGK